MGSDQRWEEFESARTAVLQNLMAAREAAGRHPLVKGALLSRIKKAERAASDLEMFAPGVRAGRRVSLFGKSLLNDLMNMAEWAKDWAIAILFVAGVGAALITMVVAVTSFLDAMGFLLKYVRSTSEVFVSTAFALGVSASAANMPAGGNELGKAVATLIVVPIILVCVAAYGAAIYRVFWGTNPSHRKDGLEMVKMLTPFFIGILSGKAI